MAPSCIFRITPRSQYRCGRHIPSHPDSSHKFFSTVCVWTMRTVDGFETSPFRLGPVWSRIMYYAIYVGTPRGEAKVQRGLPHNPQNLKVSTKSTVNLRLQENTASDADVGQTPGIVHSRDAPPSASSSRRRSAAPEASSFRPFAASCQRVR